MKGRGFFVTILLLLSILSTGCVSMENGEVSVDFKNISNSLPTLPLTSSHNLGEQATNNGLEVSVEDYRKGKQLRFSSPHQASTGAVFVAVKLRVKNVGEVEKKIPSSYVWEVKGSDLKDLEGKRHSDIELEYNGKKESILFPQGFGIPLEFDKYFTLENERYRSYERNKGIQDELHLYPGVDRVGWLVYELPENFDPQKVRVKVDFSGKTHVWKLSLKEVSIREIKQNPEKYRDMSFSTTGLFKEVTVAETEHGRKIKYVISDGDGHNQTIKSRSIRSFRREIGYDISESTSQEYVIEGHLEKSEDEHMLVLEKVRVVNE